MTDAASGDDPWDQAGERWSSITEKLRQRYEEVAGDDGPTTDDVRDAVRTLSLAARTMFDSIGEAMRDPEVRDHVKDAAASVVSALGDTFGELGDELKRRPDDGNLAPDEEE